MTNNMKNKKKTTKTTKIKSVYIKIIYTLFNTKLIFFVCFCFQFSFALTNGIFFPLFCLHIFNFNLKLQTTTSFTFLFMNVIVLMMLLLLLLLLLFFIETNKNNGINNWLISINFWIANTPLSAQWINKILIFLRIIS